VCWRFVVHRYFGYSFSHTLLTTSRTQQPLKFSRLSFPQTALQTFLLQQIFVATCPDHVQTWSQRIRKAQQSTYYACVTGVKSHDNVKIRVTSIVEQFAFKRFTRKPKVQAMNVWHTVCNSISWNTSYETWISGRLQMSTLEHFHINYV